MHEEINSVFQQLQAVRRGQDRAVIQIERLSVCGQHVLPNDKVFVSGDMVTITEFFRFLGRNNQKVRTFVSGFRNRLSGFGKKEAAADE